MQEIEQNFRDELEANLRLLLTEIVRTHMHDLLSTSAFKNVETDGEE